MKIFRAFSQTALLLTLFIAATLVACKDDNKEPEPTVDNDPIVGTWQVTAITPETAGTSIPAISQITGLIPCIYDLKLTFNNNNTLTNSGCDAAIVLIGGFVPLTAGTNWKVNGNKLTLTNGNNSQEFNYTRTDTELRVIVNTNTDTTKPPVNAVLAFKRV